MGRGHAGRSGADHGDPPARPRRRGGGGRAIERQGQVAGVAIAFGNTLGQQLRLRVGPNRLDAELLGDVTLEGADGYRRVDGAAAARVFARRGADAAADRGKGVGSTRDEEGLFRPAVGDQLDVAAGVGGHGTAGLALDLGFPVREIRQLGANAHPSLLLASVTHFKGLGYDVGHIRP